MGTIISDGDVYLIEDSQKTQYELCINQEYKENINNPRHWDYCGVMICWHNRHHLGHQSDLGDLKSDSTPTEFLELLIKKIYGCIVDYSKDMECELQKCDDIAILSLYEDMSSGSLQLSTDQKVGIWRGYFYIYKTDYLKVDKYAETSAKSWKLRAYEYMENEISVYNAYLRGDCYYYVIKEYGEDDNDDVPEYSNTFYTNQLEDMLDEDLTVIRKESES